MGTVGGVSCDFLRGRAPGPQEAVEFATRAGLDGIDARSMGLRAGPFAFIATRIAAGATVETWIASLEALAGTLVTITGDDGVSFPSCLIGGAEGGGITVVSKIPCLMGGAACYWCEVQVSGVRNA